MKTDMTLEAALNEIAVLRQQRDALVEGLKPVFKLLSRLTHEMHHGKLNNLIPSHLCPGDLKAESMAIVDAVAPVRPQLVALGILP